VGGLSPLDLQVAHPRRVHCYPPDFKHPGLFVSEHQRILKTVSIPARSLIILENILLFSICIENERNISKKNN
jgi:hypothetical protein